MVWVRWGLLLSFGLFLSPVCKAAAAAAERHGSRGGFRRLYVLQPAAGPGPGSAAGEGAVRLSTISTRHGPSGRPLAYNVELTGSFGGQVRNRRMGNPQQQQQQQEQNQLMKLSGVNVCGGQCCHGWSKTQGSQRCTKPNCFPACQNGGMCLRPQLCVCKPGSKGKTCEETTVPAHSNPVVPGSEPTNGQTNGHTNRNNVVPHRPIPQQVSPNGYTSTNNLAQMKLTVKAAPQFVRPHYIQQHIQQQIRPVPIHPVQSQQYVIKPKYYHTHTTQTQMHIQPQPDRPIPLTVGHNSIHAALGNQTGRIKVVFTPTICKVTCIGSRCHNNCEKGNTTTIISENGHTTDTLTAPNFRVVVCHLPCINGGKCSARDKCQCPPNFAGKFCQMPVHNGHQQQQSSVAYGQAQILSTHTLPLTYSHGQTPVFNPGIVNIHIKHPPEASVQVHQVSQLDSYGNNGHQQQGSHSGSSSSSSYIYHHSESSQKIQQYGYNMVYPNQHGYKAPDYQPVTSKNTLGRCFQETAAGQCGKALPGLTKLEQCCSTIGTSWGFHKCQKCPNKPSIPLINCPLGYKIINSSNCQDVDECLLNSVCPNGDCLNTMGSYMCTCKPGYVPDSTLTSCIPKFKEICPGGMGYTVLPNPPVNKPVTVFQEDILPLQPLPTPEKPVEAFGTQEEIIPEVVERTSPPIPVEILPSNAGQDIAPTQLAEVNECQINPYICGQGVCYNTAERYTCHCDEGYHLDDSQTTCVDIDECENKTVCPSGICYNEPGGHSCGSCRHGFVGKGGHCIDIDECDNDHVCIRGHCLNTEGSFVCQCGPGFRVSSTGDQCDDVDECLEESSPCQDVGECVNTMGSYTCTCPEGYRGINGTSCIDVDECVEETELCSPHGTCLNTKGSYMCVCDSGFTANHHTPSCDDIDECGLNETRCGPHGFCENRLGSFRCLCDQGYQESPDGQSCEDVNECELLSSVCGEAECMNMDGSFICVCPEGQDYNVMIAKCEPSQTGPSVERKDCYYHLSDENLCESVLSSHLTLQECCCTLGAGWGDNCEVYPCPVNGTDQFSQMCPSGIGFIPNEDLFNGITFSNSFKDADECMLFEKEVCKGGYCGNTEGSYECYCASGHYYDPIKLECTDVNECLDESICGGECLNTDGSYICFCKHPMVLDPNSGRCVVPPQLAEQQEMEQEDYQGICWQKVTETKTCTQPLGLNRKTTFTECCCRYGEAWGMECALCPARHSEDYASMCNIRFAGRLQPYGHDALVAGPVHEYEVSPDYLPSPDEQHVPNFDENEEYRYSAFEGLQAEECGILNGCENGRCVRVQEGYTCDCFAGYTLDLSRMACVDVNECSELNARMVLCKNGKCINTVGSYQCECLPGYRLSDKPNYCVKADKRQASTHAQ